MSATFEEVSRVVSVDRRWEFEFATKSFSLFQLAVPAIVIGAKLLYNSFVDCGQKDERNTLINDYCLSNGMFIYKEPFQFHDNGIKNFLKKSNC